MSQARTACLSPLPSRRERVGLWASLFPFLLNLLLFLAVPSARSAGIPLLTGQDKAAGPSTRNLPTATASELTTQLQLKLAEAQAELNRILAALDQSATPPPGATAPEVIDYRSLLQRLVNTYQLHLDDSATLEAARSRREELSNSIKAWSGFSEPAPYSVLLVDDLRDSIQSLQERIKAAETTDQVVQTFLSEAQAMAKDSEEQQRRLDEQAGGTKNPEAETRLTWQRKLEQARGRAAAATAASFETRRQIALGELAEARERLAFAQRKLTLAAEHVRFSQADLDKVMSDLAIAQRQLEKEIQDASAELDARQVALGEARAAWQKALQDSTGGGTNAAAPARLQERVETRELERQTGVQMLSVLRQLLEGVGNERQMWQTRFALAESRDLGEFQAIDKRLVRIRELIRTAKPYYRQQIELAANQITEEEKRLLGQGDAPAEASLTRQRIESYQRREAIYRRALQGLEKRERAVARWQEALDQFRKRLPFSERVRDLFTEASTFTSKLWNLELFAVQETVIVDGQTSTRQRGVTLGKIFTAILILTIGYWISNLAAGLLERVVRQRLKVEPNQSNLIRRWVRVVLVLGLIVFALVSVKIPLTIFAFAGGALAIGVGFGTQNLLKNFISGIVILFERPFRVGDVLAVGNHTGLVTSIGIRSSVIQLWDSTETLIPNSALLENNLTNWTYSNRLVRFSVTVGVAYGSDTRRVSQLLAEVVDRHGQVEKEPRPQVLFTNFADSALTFELRYWVQVLKHNSAQIASDLRHMIHGAFKDEGIVIAFPQQDVNLRSEKPLAFEMVARPAIEVTDPLDRQPRNGAAATGAPADPGKPSLP